MTENILIDENRMKDIEENIKRIRFDIEETAIRNNRSPEEVRLMAVTKTVEVPYINKAIECGIDLIGENRVQEFLKKKDTLNLENCEKHLIGHLQTNKIRQIVEHVDMIQSVDSLKTAKEISKQSEKNGITTNILVEVNIGKEESKSGCHIEQLEELLYKIADFSCISVKGLMTIPPICETSTEIRRYFEKMSKSFVDIRYKKMDNIAMDILSMGMSGDYKEAIAEGSTLVRVGSALFGARSYV